MAPGDVDKAIGGGSEDCSSAGEEFGGRCGALKVGQDDEEASATGGAEEQRRQAEFGKEGPRQHFAYQREPNEARFERSIVASRHGVIGGLREKEFFRPSEPALQEDLGGHYCAVIR